MSILPDNLQKYWDQASQFLKKGLVGDIEFAGGTYQVQVNDPSIKEPVWAFFQFDPLGVLRDRFCSCEGEKDIASCIHLAAAYLAIFREHTAPLHLRFQDSLWNQICQTFSDQYGIEPDIIKEISKGHYVIGKSKKQPIFSVQGTTVSGIKKLHELFKERRIETEESSLKFSNLPMEEIILWREGRPSSYLRYELSFWSDLAKWLMILQDQELAYKIIFKYDSKRFPVALSIVFKEVNLSFSLNKKTLQTIIPALTTVESPLKVYFSEERSIQEITYKKEKGELHINAKTVFPKKQQELEEKGHLLDDWIYIPEDGFYAREQHHLLENPVLKGKEINEALEDHLPLLKKYLKGTEIQDQPEQLSYSLHFDSDWNLIIKAYLYSPGDLQQPYSHYFGEWVYLDGKGFIKADGVYFDDSITKVPSEEVAEFATQHRAWLNTQEGFQTHVTGIESKLSYQLNENNVLTFFRTALLEESNAKDFGNWVYIEGEGFFAKTDSGTAQSIRPGMTINEGQIPTFIRSNQSELQFIPGFFSPICPVVGSCCDIELTPYNTIKIIPIYEISPSYSKKHVQIFDDCTYVKGEGFSLISPANLLPERYRQAMELTKDNFCLFFSLEWEGLKKYARNIDPRLTRPASLRLTSPKITLEKEGYILKLQYQSEQGSVDASELWNAIHHKDKYAFTNAGLLDLADERFKWLSTIKKGQIDRRSNKWILSTLDLLRQYVYEPLHVQENYELYRDLLEFKITEEPDLTSLKSNLRPYQYWGVKWLWFLYLHKLSGLLCDDMGLGKTHQSMAMLAAVSNYRIAKGLGKGHYLIVCPTSVIFHWEEKLQHFLPNAKVCTFHGVKRSLKDFQHEYDILLTSYGILRNEQELLSEVQFEVAIFDEIQAAKIQTSGIHAALLKMKAIMRIGLTGTPIENRLRELKALFDLVLPKYMPSENEYRQHFIYPIERENNLARRQQLSRFVKPFVLRRTKKDVLLDLPEKVEEIAHCELSGEQAVMYTDVLHRMRSGIIRQLQDQTNSIPYLHIFSVLSSLKQICNHPAAFLKDPENYKDYQSGKWDLFTELFSEAQESGQKVVVYSQYLAMLDIIEIYLREQKISYAAIRGATTDRGQQVRKFNLDPECKVFVGSLQAAGLGIDLTAASVVIHYDRWWNAAREAQATDRVHRIGQTRGVQVFKLVTKGTFEERIDEMITRKGKLMEDVIGVDEHQFVKKFDRNELIELLQDL